MSLTMILPKILSTTGLILDIAGAWLVALDLIRTFRGPRFEHERPLDEIFLLGLSKTIDGGPPEETEEFRRWDDKTRRFRKRGLVVLTFGFFLQALSNWV